MNVPTPAAMAAPLHLYDYTHGQRRLTLWREPDLHGRLAVYASVAVPVIEQPPGEAPETLWREVATGRSYQPSLVMQQPQAEHGAVVSTWCLVLETTGLPVAEMEAEAIARYLGMALPLIEGGAA